MNVLGRDDCTRRLSTVLGRPLFESSDLPAELAEIRARVRELCTRFPAHSDRLSDTCVTALTDSCGGADPGHSVITEGTATFGRHAQMYTMGTILRHGSARLTSRRACSYRAFGDHGAGRRFDTSIVHTTAERDRGRVRARRSGPGVPGAILLLARTTPLNQVQKHSDVLDLPRRHQENSRRPGIRPIKAMMTTATTEVFFDGVELPPTR